MEVKTAIERFVEWCRGKHALNTCLVYESRLKSLAAELGPHELDALTRDQVEAWLAKANRHADGRPKAPDTIRSTAITFKSFQRWAVDYGFLRLPIVERIKKPMGRWRERVPKAEETAKLLEHASSAFTLIYQALPHSGARPNELCRATVADWHRDDQVIVLAKHKTAEKTGRARQIAVGAKLEALLLTAIGDRPEGPIFLSPRGRPWTPQRLSIAYRTLRDRAGLKKDLVLYLARHEHGSAICKKLGIKAACEALGHESITTTQRYAHSSAKERAANQDAFE